MNGVTYDKTRKRYRARAKTEDGQRRHLGWFRTREGAEDAVSVHTQSLEEADFEKLKNQIEEETAYIKTPVTRRWRKYKPTFLTRASLFVQVLWSDVREAWDDTKY